MMLHHFKQWQCLTVLLTIPDRGTISSFLKWIRTFSYGLLNTGEFFKRKEWSLIVPFWLMIMPDPGMNFKCFNNYRPVVKIDTTQLFYAPNLNSLKHCMMQLTTEQRVFCVTEWIRTGSLQEVANRFGERFPDFFWRQPEWWTVPPYDQWRNCPPAAGTFPTTATRSFQAIVVGSRWSTSSSTHNCKRQTSRTLQS